jgi:hypothetical protein
MSYSRYKTRNSGDDMIQIEPWKLKGNGVYLTSGGNIYLRVEKIGVNFRVLVTRIVDKTHPEEIVYSGSSDTANEAMAIAKQVAERVSA